MNRPTRLNNNNAVLTKNMRKRKPNKGRVSGDLNPEMGNQLVVYIHPKGIPFPTRYRTTLRCAISGNIVAGTSPSVYFISGNSAYLPFNGGSWPGVLTANTSTLQPAGFSNLCSNGSIGPYNNFRVLDSKCTFKASTSVLTDVVTVTLHPVQGNTAPSGVADSLAEPRSKSIVLNTRSGQISTGLPTHLMFGVRPESVQNDFVGLFSGQYNAGPTQNLKYWVCWTTSTGGALAGAIGYDAELIQEVEFFNLNVGALLDN